MNSEKASIKVELDHRGRCPHCNGRSQSSWRGNEDILDQSDKVLGFVQRFSCPACDGRWHTVVYNAEAGAEQAEWYENWSSDKLAVSIIEEILPNKNFAACESYEELGNWLDASALGDQMTCLSEAFSAWGEFPDEAGNFARAAAYQIVNLARDKVTEALPFRTREVGDKKPEDSIDREEFEPVSFADEVEEAIDEMRYLSPVYQHRRIESAHDRIDALEKLVNNLLEAKL